MRTYLRVQGNRADEVAGEVVREQPLTIHVNGAKFLTLLCSPIKLEALVVGYLWMEKVIEDLAEITRLDVSPVDGRAEVTLAGPVALPTERILTSGCGGGITFRIYHRLFPRLDSALRVAPVAVALAEQLNVTICGYVRGDSLNLYAGSALRLGEAAVEA